MEKSDENIQVMEDKVKENRKSAEILYENKYYNASVSRYYYSIYQMILAYNIENDIEKFTGKDSHTNTIKAFVKSIDASKSSKGLLNKDIKQIKKARKIADYEGENVTKEDIDDCIEKFHTIQNMLEK